MPCCRVSNGAEWGLILQAGMVVFNNGKPLKPDGSIGLVVAD